MAANVGKWVAASVLIAAGYIGLKIMRQPKLKYFKAGEFGAWWPFMNRELLLKLDQFRELWGAPVMISPANGALGREEEGSHSQHNVLKWGEVRAADVMPQGMDTSADRERAFRIARQVGFTGIGIYPDWKPSAGLHLDVREDRTAQNPALWAGVLDDRGNQIFTNIMKGLG